MLQTQQQQQQQQLPGATRRQAGQAGLGISAGAKDFPPKCPD